MKSIGSPLGTLQMPVRRFWRSRGFALDAFEPFCLHNEGVRYLFDTSPPLLTPEYDGNYIPSNRCDWWVTLVAVVYNDMYNVMYMLLSLSAFIMRG